VNHLIRAGTYLLSRPTYSTTVVVSGTSYYYAGGVYYVSHGSRYVIVTPPHGVVVYSIPIATTVVYVGSTPYYYYSGTYYVATAEPAPKPETSETTVNVNVNVTSEATTDRGEKVNLPPLAEDDEEENYKVVAPPTGATVPYLPEEATEKTVKGKKYFVYGGAYYRPFASDGETIYMVVEDPS
jgi:hypothetical protein